MLATETPKGPLAISVIQDGTHYKVLVRSTNGAERLMVQASDVATPVWRRLLTLGPSPADVVQAVAPSISTQYLSLVKDPNCPKELLAMEERQVIRSYKFGFLYAAAGQTLEEQLFANNWDQTSPHFRQFLNFLGERIELKSWKGYRAGLDTNDNQTGTHSYYTKWQGYEVMFHVGPMLPFTVKGEQQIERKRFIGNDIVVIIFQESDQPIKLNTFSSKQNHVFAIVRPHFEKSSASEATGYHVSIVNKMGVPAYTPDLPEPTFIERNAMSRDFFFHKLVNGERASYRAPSFAPKISRTRSVLLYDVAERFLLK